VGSLFYCAPEVLLGEINCTESIDMWAVGVIFAEMFICNSLFSSECQIDHIFRVFRYSHNCLQFVLPKCAVVLQEVPYVVLKILPMQLTRNSK
jgi:serine/threonine protein kinase